MDKKNKNLLEKFSQEERKKINDFFRKKENFELLNKIENHRKKRRIVGRIVYSTVLLPTFIGLILLTIKIGDFNEVMIRIFFLMFILSSIIISYINKKAGLTLSIKKDLLPKFIKVIDKDISYDESDKFFDGDLDILSGTDIIEYYTKVSKKEDSINFDFGRSLENGKKSMNLKGCEIKTTKTVKTKNGSRTVITNHAYITKITFNNSSFSFKTPILLLRDGVNSLGGRVTGAFIGMLVYFVFLGFLENIFKVSDFQVLGEMLIFGGFPLVMFLGYYFSDKILKKNLVRMENIDFEKKFDVKCEDPLESRKLLTPAFMQRILDYVNNISNSRKYEFYFVDNVIYIKYDLMSKTSGYLEFSESKPIMKNVKDFAEFYLEIKNIISLAEDLNLEYYDKA